MDNPVRHIQLVHWQKEMVGPNASRRFIEGGDCALNDIFRYATEGCGRLAGDEGNEN